MKPTLQEHEKVFAPRLREAISTARKLSHLVKRHWPGSTTAGYAARRILGESNLYMRLGRGLHVAYLQAGGRKRPYFYIHDEDGPRDERLYVPRDLQLHRQIAPLLHRAEEQLDDLLVLVGTRFPESSRLGRAARRNADDNGTLYTLRDALVHDLAQVTSKLEFQEHRNLYEVRR